MGLLWQVCFVTARFLSSFSVCPCKCATKWIIPFKEQDWERPRCPCSGSILGLPKDLELCLAVRSSSSHLPSEASPQDVAASVISNVNETFSGISTTIISYMRKHVAYHFA